MSDSGTKRDAELAIEKRWLLAAKVDPEDFRRFYAKYGDRVYRFCLRRTLDRDTAEDLTAETFLQAQRNLWRFRWQGVTFGAYLYRIALNLVRKHAAAAARTLNVAEPDAGVVDPRANPLAELVLTERQLAVRQAVATLDGRSQEIFLLHYWEELTTAEIAVVLKVPEGTVKTKLSRGRQALRAELGRRDLASPGPLPEPPPRAPGRRKERE